MTQTSKSLYSHCTFHESNAGTIVLSLCLEACVNPEAARNQSIEIQMKTQTYPRILKLKTLALAAAALILPAATGLAQTLWVTNTEDYNNPTFWNGTYNGGSNPNTSNDNGSNNVVLIQPGDPVWQHGDTLAGNGNNTSGAYLQTGSTNDTGGGNWLRMGIGSGSFGYYVLSNGTVNVGGRTQIGENGTGYVEIDGGVYNGNVNDGGANPAMVCGQGDFGPGTGTLVINGGVVTYTRETWFGEQGGSTGTGYFFMNGGTLNLNDWVAFGRNGGTGYGVMTAGTINFTGGGRFLIGAGGFGALAQSGGVLNVFNQYLIPQSDGGIGGRGTNTLSGTAVVNAHGWIAVGRNSGYGELNISGNAAITRDNSTDGGANFDVGAGGPGVVNQNGGAITNNGGQTWIGENSTATWNLNSGVANLGTVHICQTGSATGTLNVNGGSLIVAELTVGDLVGFSTLNLNGGTILAAGNNATFLHDIFDTEVLPGGAIFDSQGFNITISETLNDSGGGLTKNGAGTLLLTGTGNTYSGATIVNGGTLGFTTASASSANGAYTVNNGAALSLQVLALNGQLSASSFTLAGTASALGFDLGSFGNPAFAPLNVTAGAGALTVNGTVTINVLDSVPQIGQFPLIKYTTKSGSGSFVLGSVPVGMAASLVNNTGNHSIDLNITSVNLPRWEGLAGGNWDINLTTNWINIGTGLPTKYSDGSPVLFNDQALGTTSVNLVTTVSPSSVTFNNSTLSYTVAGTGKISGSTAVSVQGAGVVNVLNTGGNNYTGPTVLSGGVLAVTNLANGGSPSAIGASSANPTNLVLNGGDLSYSGPAVTINRGYLTEQTNSSITTVNNLTLSGVANAAQFGGLNKTGNAQLTYVTVGSNVLSGVSSPGYIVHAGTVRFDGSAGGQTNTIQGDRLGVDGVTGLASVLVTNSTVNVNGNVDVGNEASTTGSMTVDGNSTLTISSWLIFNDGGGNTTNTLSLNAGTVNQNNGRLLMGGRPGGTSILNINGGVFNHSGDVFDIADGNWNGPGARLGIVNQAAGTFNCNQQCFIGMQPGGTGIYNLSGGSLFLNDWTVVGRSGGVGFFNMTGGNVTRQNNGQAFIVGSDDGGNSVGTVNQSGGVFTCNTEYWLGVDGGRIGTNNISGTAEFDMNSWFSIGRGGLGVVSLSGGTINKNGNGAFIIGDGGTGFFTQTGGTNNTDGEVWVGQSGSGVGEFDMSAGVVNANNWVAIGRAGGHGTLNISGGSITKTGGGNFILAPDSSSSLGIVNQTGGGITNLSSETHVGSYTAGTGIWNLNGGYDTLGLLVIGQDASSIGTFNLNTNGTLTAAEIMSRNSGASSTFNFSGGTLVAGADNTNFIHDLSAANVNAGGAIINTASHSVSVNQALLGVAADGGLTKNGNGTLYLNGVNTYTNLTQVNAGALGGVGTILGTVTVASGARLSPGTASIGTLTVNKTLTFAAGSSAFVKISLDGGVTNNDQVAGLTSVAYAGTLVVTNVGSTALVAGAQFKLFNSATPGSGNFSSVTLLPVGTGTFNPLTGVLTITSAGVVTFNRPHVSGSNLILTGTGGTPGGSYSWLTSTNVTTPIAIWTTNTTGFFNGSGAFSNGIPIIGSEHARFFILRTP